MPSDWAEAKAREIMTDHDLRPLANTEREIAAALRAERARAGNLVLALEVLLEHGDFTRSDLLLEAKLLASAALAAWKESADA